VLGAAIAVKNGAKRMMDIRTYYLAAACCILPLSPFAPALADADEPPEEGGERCIDTSVGM